MFANNLLRVPEYVSGTREDSFPIRLSSNENNYGPSPRVIRKIKQLSKLSHKYPESSYTLLKRAIAKENNIPASKVILGNGSDEIFLNLFLMYLTPNSSLLTIEKTFTYYKILASIIGAEVIEAKREKNFSISCNNILSAMKPSVKILIFPSPDNPTGVTVDRKCIENILRNIPESTIFILDEAYFQFVPKSKYWESIELIDKFPNFIVTRTFSKLYALAGLRLGYGICSEEIAKLYEKMRMPFNISSLASECAIEALADKNYYSKILRKILRDKRILKHEFKKLGLNVLEKSYGNFLFIQGPKDLDKKLLESGIVIRNLESFGYDKTYYRITIGTRKENKILLECLRKILGGTNDN
ncbi:MAG: histidinol-phosphate transaminase [Brevinematia bacterium]